MFYVIQENTSTGYSCANYENLEDAKNDFEFLTEKKVDDQMIIKVDSGETVVVGKYMLFSAEQKQESDIYCGIPEDYFYDCI